jgi:hypothetical protein
MPAPLALALLLGAAAPATDDFASRVQQARLAEAADAGTAYQKALWKAIGTTTTDAYQACLAGNQHDQTPFTLVLDVDAQGKPHHVVAQPDLPVARCLAARFAQWTYPTPPATPRPYPLEIDFSVAGGK